MWTTTRRVFLQWFQPLHRAYTNRRTLFQELGAARKVLLGVPAVLAGAGAVLAGSQVVATTAMSRRNSNRSRQLNKEDPNGKTQEVKSHPHTSNHGYTELEQFLRQQFVDNASCVVQGQSLMTAADFVGFVRGNKTKTEDKIIDESQVIQPHSCDNPSAGVEVGLGVQPEKEEVMKEGRHTTRIPQKWQTSAHFFRDLGEDGLLDLADFVLLLHILTTSPEFFKPIFKVLTNGGASLLTANDFHYMKLALAPKQPTTGTTRGRRQQWNILQAPWRRLSTAMIPALCQGSMMRMGLTTRPVSSEDGRRSKSSEDGGSLVGRMFTRDSGRAERHEEHVSCISAHLFGTRGQVGGIRYWDLKRFILNVHREVLEVEFAELAGGKDYLNLQEFSNWTFRFTAEDREDKMADRTTVLHDNSNTHVTIDDLQSLHDVIRYHLTDVTDAMKLYTVLTPSGLTSPRDVQEVVQLGSGMRLEAGLCESVFLLFSDASSDVIQGRRFDVELFSDVMHRRRSFGLPLKVTEDVSVTLEDDGELEEAL